MANPKDDKTPNRITSNVKKLVLSLQDNIDKFYQNTYFSTTSNSRDLSKIKSGIDRSIDNIISNNMNNVGIPAISKLYARALPMQNDKSVVKDVAGIFDDKVMMDNVLNSYMQNKWLKDFDNEIDVVCKYMPKLQEALDTRKDNVLSSDHFSKDFINIANESNIKKEISFAKRIEELKERYDLAELFDSTYDDAAKYGEQFLYIVPYKKALAKLLANKANTRISKMNMESGRMITDDGSSDVISPMQPELASYLKDKNIRLELELNQSNMIDSIIEAGVNARGKLKSISESSIAMFNEAKKVKGSVTIDNGFSSKLSYDNFEDSDDAGAKDGLITPTTKTTDEGPKLNIPGCIVKKIDRCNIIPIYIEELCLGYYYLEFKGQDDFEINNASMTDPVMGMKSSTNGTVSQSEHDKQDQMLRYMSGQLSTFIDNKFINANQDLRKEIYMILKHNDTLNTPSVERIKVTFLPPEDVEHIYFKKDKRTNRGISDLHKALLPAKLYSSLYVTNTLAILTRGQDKRVYYVKQNIDTNISKVLLNTIDQIKRSNFGIRQIENMNNILNITGKFNDYIVPVGPDGNSPVQFEVMQGQNVDIKTDLMNILEEMAINSTDVPLELIQARQSIDYALQLTMTNSKFLRKVYNRQARCQKHFGSIVTKIYNSEYEEDDILSVTLPPPMFLNVTNTNQLMANTAELTQTIVDMEMADEQDETIKAIFARNIKRHYLGSYLNMANIEQLKNAAKQEAELKKDPNAQQQ